MNGLNTSVRWKEYAASNGTKFSEYRNGMKKSKSSMCV
jgi:hypothetical protein